MNSNYEEPIRSTLKHIIINLSKVKEKSLKAIREKQHVTYKVEY